MDSLAFQEERVNQASLGNQEEMGYQDERVSQGKLVHLVHLYIITETELL